MVEVLVAILCTFGSCSPPPSPVQTYASVVPVRPTPAAPIYSPCIATDLKIGTHQNGNPCSNN